MTARGERLSLPPFYAIVDAEQAIGGAELALRHVLEGGAKIVQLRAKKMNSRELLDLAKQARQLTDAFHCQLIINDRIDIALASNADGAHLGQDDLPAYAGRKLLHDKVLGISTHSVEQAREAERCGADYIGFGPIFGTRTKDTGYRARGLEMLQQIRATTPIPIVAIGGITESTIRDVWSAGAHSCAIISDVLRSDDLTAKVRRILALRQDAPQ
jgi:thiamine-phosphate pyrophosphorylase